MAQPKGPKRPTNDPIKWQLQIEGGKSLGPLSTEDLLLRISEGILGGNEKIRKLPDGPWTAVSREPIFYDKLLEALYEDGEKDDDKTVIRPASANIKSPRPPLPKPGAKAAVPPEALVPKDNILVPFQASTPALRPPRAPGLPVTAQQPIQFQAPKKKSPALFVTILLLILSVGGYLAVSEGLKPSEQEYQGLQIKLPRPSTRTSLTPEQQNKELSEIYQLIFHDSIAEYDQAQTKLISFIEKAPLVAEPRGLLCLVQLNLWPYVRQNSEDLENLKLAKIAGSRLDPVGLAGVHCEVSFLMVMGKYRDAMGLIEHTSNRREIAEESPVLYSTKAEILASEKTYKEAVGWAEAAAKLWPQWAHPFYQVGLYSFEIAENAKAAEAFERALFLNPKHRQSLIEYGVLIYLRLKDSARAEQFLLAATKSADPISKFQEAKMYYYLAKISGDKSQNDKALEYVQKAYQLNPGDLKARDYLIQLGGSPTQLIQTTQKNELVFLGDQYARAGDFLAAQAEYKAAFQLDPKNALAAMKAGKALWQLYQAEEARLWLGKAITADPKLSIPYFLMADYYSQQFNFAGAGEILGRGASKLPNNVDILRGYGLVELRRNNHKQAIVYLEKALKITEDVDTLMLLAKAYLTSKDAPDPQKAMAYATKAIQLEDANPDAQIVYAKVLAALNGVPAAVTYMKERIQKFSYTTDYILGLAEIYQEAERYSDAQAEYEKIFLLDNKNKRALLGLGTCYQARAMLEKALKTFLSAAVQDPSDPEPVFKAGMVYMDAGRAREALNQFQRGVNINKFYPKGYIMLGRAALALKEIPMALGAANQEKKNNPSLADAYILAGDVYKESHEFSKCGTEYQNAVRLRPKGADNYVKMAQCMIWAGNLEVAENMLAIAKDQENGFADIYKLQGAIFEKKGEKQEACQAYQNFSSLAPNAPDKKDIEDKISRLCGGR